MNASKKEIVMENKELLINFLNAYSKNLNDFCKREYYELNRHLFLLALKGIGVSNYQNSYISGEETFLNWCLKQIECPIVFDVGANQGNYAISAKKINEKSVIFSFEPHPVSYEKLKSNSGGGHTFNAINLGLSDSNKEIEIYDYENDQGSEHASLYKEVIENLHKGKPKSHLVKLISLDYFITISNINHIHLLKIDTEGHELEVLKGAANAIQNNQIDLIHIEFNEMNVYSRVFFKDISDFLKNYNFFRMLPDGLVPLEPYNPLFCEIFHFQNIVAINKKVISNSNH